MTASDPTLLIFHGGAGSGDAEQDVAAARVKAALASIDLALSAGFREVIVATDSPSLFDHGNPAVTIDKDADDGAQFVFGERLAALVERNDVVRPVVLGAGSLPLLGHDEFRAVADAIGTDVPSCVTNNFYSSDLTGWFPGHLLQDLSLPQRDNALPRLIREQCGTDIVHLPRSTATQFDLDTPTDVAILAVATGIPGPFPAIEKRARAMMTLFSDRDAEVLVAGRVGSLTWRYLESQTACRVRLISEERGLSSAPSGYRGRSVLGLLMEDRQAGGLFEALELLGDGTFLDSRVVFEHFGAEFGREDRFQSDLLAPSRIEDPWLREFATAAAGTPGQLLIGGHSLVSGGLMALNDAAWTELERFEADGPKSTDSERP